VISARIVLVLSGTSFTSTSTDHANTTCAGTGTNPSSSTGTFTIGSTVSTTLNGSPVTAYQVDVTVTGVGTFYDLGYVDTSTTPHRQYEGDTSGANNGTTPALRPTTLDGSFFFVKQ
jgi:hypothetical protein